MPESNTAPARKNRILWFMIAVGIAVGVILTLYGFAETWHKTRKFIEWGNRTAAEAAWERFAFRYAGGWIGACVALFIRSLYMKMKPNVDRSPGRQDHDHRTSHD